MLRRLRSVRGIALLGLFAGMWLVSPIAYGATVEELEAKIDSMRQEYGAQMAAMKTQIDALKTAVGARDIVPSPLASSVEGKTLPGIAQDFQKKDISPKFGGVYTKPFLQRLGHNTYVGGYMDFSYNDSQNTNARFEQKRMIPFLYSDVSDRVKFATEIEFEDGGSNFGGSDDGEISIEFATMDYLINEKINFRGGLFLSPLGKYNLVHDSPLQESFTRPLVDTFVIPTTLSEAGVGLYGNFYPTELAKIDYEIYLTNGFRGLDGNGTNRFSRTNGVRDARGSAKADINDRPAVVGRLAYSPFLGLEVAYSTHVGTYDQRKNNRLWINAADLTFQKGPFEFLGECAYDKIGRNEFAQTSGVPGDMWGYYLQGNYHFMPEWLKKTAAAFFKDESTFTLFTRWDHMDLDGNTRQKVTPGLTFRPTPDTVFGLDYQGNIDNHSHTHTKDDAIEAWFATYF